VSAANQIQFDSNIPYYVQLVEILKEPIRRSELKPGDQLPGEFELCEQFGISRTVVRQALQELEKEGLIQRRKGKGTFVAPSKIDENLVQKLTGFYQDMTSRGQAPKSQVLRFEVIPVCPKIAELLQLSTDQNVFVIERLRSVNDDPIVLVTTYLPYHLCPELGRYDLSEQSLYAILSKSSACRYRTGGAPLGGFCQRARRSCLGSSRCSIDSAGQRHLPGRLLPSNITMRCTAATARALSSSLCALVKGKT
jgi:GntR family transcriptional regulator